MSVVRAHPGQPRCTVSLYAVAGRPLYPRKQASQTATRVLAREHSTNFGLKVFMDAHKPVTLEEGDRYPLGPPNINYSICKRLSE